MTNNDLEIYCPEEAYEYMCEKNVALKKMKETFDLEFE